MGALNLEMFLAAQRDYESSQLHILGGLQKIRREFSHNRIYPPLAELIDLYRTLRTITQNSEGLRAELPKRIKELDLKEGRIVYENLDMGEDALAAIEELVEWAMPHIHAAIEEGQTIFNFVDENLTVHEVGLVPSYVEEGYLMVPELKRGLLHIVRYEITIFTGADQNYRNLKTQTIDILPLNRIGFEPIEVKHDLIEHHRELPNPATYLFSTELDFPFNETILPIAKRKLLRRLYS
jgi:hypothetical protein